MNLVRPVGAERRSRSPHARGRGRIGLFTLILVAVAAGQAGAQSGGDLTQASIEDLMRLQVTSVSKKEQKLSKAGASVFVITAEDIRRSGATNIPDVLRMAPGVDVAQIDAGAW